MHNNNFKHQENDRQFSNIYKTEFHLWLGLNFWLEVLSCSLVCINLQPPILQQNHNTLPASHTHFPRPRQQRAANVPSRTITNLSSHQRAPTHPLPSPTVTDNTLVIAPCRFVKCESGLAVNGRDCRLFYPQGRPGWQVQTKLYYDRVRSLSFNYIK